MISHPNLDKHFRALAALMRPDAARRALAATMPANNAQRALLALMPSDTARRALAATMPANNAQRALLALMPADTARHALAAVMKPATDAARDQQRRVDAMRLEIASLCREMAAPIIAAAEEIEEVWRTLPPDPDFGFRPNRW